ncbi:MAG TPA: heparan-alpha-glucosaminide N-acetyltransferase domain-containing protein [Chryseolinea sp.]|nr:heparan-alpha-glucosaminide N-acetyltransferase domain-containing protein [Chryseolinea sp.]
MVSTSNGVLVEKARITSIDTVRGFVMVIMALDHVRDYFHIDAFNFNATDLERTSAVLFFTRWITHICAPTFVLLSGVSARLGLEKKSKKELSIHLLTRGLWLIFLELTVIRFGLVFNFYYDFTLFLVIWVIGLSMVILSALIYLGERAVLIIGLILVFGHNAFDGMRLQPGDSGFALWTFLNQSGLVQVSSDRFLLVPYALIPWLGILLVGYGIAHWFTSGFDAKLRATYLLRAGVGSIVIFILLRFLNVYGDPAPWSPQKNIVFTIMSFLNCTKNPVSLLFTLMTVGITFLLLWLMEKSKDLNIKPLIVFGRVPLFYFILHFYIAHFLSLLLMITTGQAFGEIDFHFSKGFGGIPPNTGVTLPWVYVVWIGVVLVCYPICKKYNEFKSTHNYWWLSYI